MPSALASAFALDPDVTYLNHGSFGACTRAALEHQAELRRRSEANPMRFFVRDLPDALAATRERVAPVVGARADDLAFVTNATAAVNAVVASLDLRAGDEVLTTDHAYAACRNALEHWAGRAGARVTVAPIPFPLASPDDAFDAILGAVTSRTRLLLVDHVTSPTALVLPVARLAAALEPLGVQVLVDGAHAPGMLPLDLEALGASYYTGNFHKWGCAPKGAAMLWAREDRQQDLHPTIVSHGWATHEPGRRYRAQFDWQGTSDVTAALTIPAALDALAALVPGGLEEVMRRNHALALAARDRLIDHLGVPPPAPDALLGSMATLPFGPGGPPRCSPFDEDPIQRALHERFRIEVPVFTWPAGGARWLRVSAQLYNAMDDYERLVEALDALELQRA